MDNIFFKMKQRPKFRVHDIQDNNDNKYINNEEGTEMTIRQHNNQRTIDTPINEGDTLQALSIRYQSSVSELKRLNNLLRDNEIFARRTIKVPFRPFLMVAVHKSGDTSPDVNLTKKSVDPNILKQKLSSVSTLVESTSNGLLDNNLIDLGSSNKESNFNEIIFNTRIADKEGSDDDVDEAFSDEEVQLLPNVEVAEPVSGEFNCSGADWGMSWPLLLAIILILGFVGPLIYIFYIAEHPEKYHPHR
ncbi:uncharacterized protein CBL_08151 [Carabus blaptoides fortunei]